MNEGFVCLKCRFPLQKGLKHAQRCDIWAKELVEQASRHASLEADLLQQLEPEYQQKQEEPPPDFEI